MLQWYVGPISLVAVLENVTYILLQFEKMLSLLYIFHCSLNEVSLSSNWKASYIQVWTKIYMQRAYTDVLYLSFDLFSRKTRNCKLSIQYLFFYQIYLKTGTFLCTILTIQTCKVTVLKTRPVISNKYSYSANTCPMSLPNHFWMLWWYF